MIREPVATERLSVLRLIGTEESRRRLTFRDGNLMSVCVSCLCMGSTLVSRSPRIMGGTPVFAGTRVPVQTLLDYLEAGETIDEFLKGFPSVLRDQVIAFLEDAKDRALAAAS